MKAAGRNPGPTSRTVIAGGLFPDSAALHPGYGLQHRANAKAVAQATTGLNAGQAC